MSEARRGREGRGERTLVDSKRPRWILRRISRATDESERGGFISAWRVEEETEKKGRTCPIESLCSKTRRERNEVSPASLLLKKSDYSPHSLPARS